MLEGVALLLLAVSALLFQRSATAPWVEARVADGRRIQVSPIGIVDFGLGTSGTAPTECRWWPKLGSEELCAETPGGARAMASLRRAYPLVVVALWTAILGIFLTALRIPHVPRAAGVVIAASLPILAMVAMRGVWVASSEALAALAGLSLQPLAAGFGSIVVGAICSAAAAVLLILSGKTPEGLKLLYRIASIVFVLMTSTQSASAQSANDAPSSKCWRFAFGAWNPPLNWEGAGHDGRAGDLAGRVQRIRDSVFARDTNAVRNKTMYWEQTKAGWSVVLFPDWWPVGVKVDFDSTVIEGREMTGNAIALVADAGKPPSRARARAARCPN